jgi:ATP-dependent Clp protease adaptor protein ClpS
MSTRELVLERPAQSLSEDAICRLVLYNDEVNTFDWVIESLVDICEHSVEQAEQCALLVHHKGRTQVKHGSLDFLLPRRRALEDRGLTAAIE